MCRVLGVSRSGYYAWRARRPSRRAQADAALQKRIKRIHEHSRGTYGRPRIHASLRSEGTHVSGKRIARLMRLAALEGVSRRKQPHRARTRKETRPAPDLVHRQFCAAGPNKLWVADITYVPTWAGFLYLAVVVDAWSRRVVGWAMATHLRSEVVVDALMMALHQRRPQQVIHHSDQGTQYTSLAFGQRCKEPERVVRKLLRHPGMRAAGAAAFQDTGRGEAGSVRVHRGLVQSASSAFSPRL